MSDTLLSVHLSAGYSKQQILHDVHFEVKRGERLAFVGSSGAGKSTLLFSLLGLLPWKGGWAKGQVALNGTNLLTLPEREARKCRGKSIALVPQSPLTALNSALSLKRHFVEAWRAHENDSAQLEARMQFLLNRVQLPCNAEFLKRRPNEISIGQAQRVTIALALLHRPQILIADEPTSALDPLIQIEALSLLREISEEEAMALVYISHDLLSVLQLCERVAVLDGGRLVECLDVSDVEHASHPTTRALLRTLPAPVSVLREYSSRRETNTKSFRDDTLPSSLSTYNLSAMVCEVISE